MSPFEITPKDRDALEIYRLQIHIASDVYGRLYKIANFARVGAVIALLINVLNVVFNDYSLFGSALGLGILFISINCTCYAIYKSRRIKKKIKFARMQISEETCKRLNIPE